MRYVRKKGVQDDSRVCWMDGFPCEYRFAPEETEAERSGAPLKAELHSSGGGQG